MKQPAKALDQSDLLVGGAEHHRARIRRHLTAVKRSHHLASFDGCKAEQRRRSGLYRGRLRFADKQRGVDDTSFGIAEARYTEQDLITINPEMEPFGVNNSPNSPYVRIKGQQYYARVRDWWTRNSYRLTVTTTERRIRMALDFIRHQQLERIDAHPQYGPALREWRSQIDTLGITARPEVPPTWRITDLPVASHLPRDRMRVQIYLDD